MWSEINKKNRAILSFKAKNVLFKAKNVIFKAKTVFEKTSIRVPLRW